MDSVINGKISNRNKHGDLSLIFILTLLATVTRLYGIGQWAIDADEVVSYVRALNHNFSITPCSDFLVSIFFSLFGDSEFTFRLPSALFGIASIPVFFILTRKLFGRYTALFGSLFILFSYFHLRHSQFGRYYSEVFFFGILAYYSYFKFFQSYNKKYLVGALISSFLGFLIHPTFLVVPFVNGIFTIIVLFNKNKYNKNTVQAAKLFLVIFGLIALFISPFFINIIRVLQSIPDIWGYKSIMLSMQIIKHFTVPITASCIFGLLWLLKKDTAKGIYYLMSISIPIVLIISASFFTNVRPAYIMYIYPIFFILSGYFCAQLKNISSNNSYFHITVVILIIFCMLPEFISHYSGMSSLDVRDTEYFLDKNYQNGDKVLSFDFGFDFYYKNKYDFENYEEINDYPDLIEKINQFKNAPYRIWIVIKTARSKISPQLNSWLIKNANLSWEKSEERFDYSFKSLRIYLLE